MGRAVPFYGNTLANLRKWRASIGLVLNVKSDHYFVFFSIADFLPTQFKYWFKIMWKRCWLRNENYFETSFGEAKRIFAQASYAQQVKKRPDSTYAQKTFDRSDKAPSDLN